MTTRLGFLGVFRVASPLKDKPQEKEQGESPARKIVSTLFPANIDLILIGGATLLVRVRVPPETWTTRLAPCG
jgi:hypothetical protein